jgi:PAS domain S-box-containing protein
MYVEVNAGITTYQGKPADLAIIRDISERRRAEDALHQAHDELERRVEERTVELSKVNALLREEIVERQKVEEELTQIVGQLRALTKGLEEAVIQRTRELQTERDRTQAILEAVGESVVVTDIQGQILYANPATSVLTGFTREEVLGRDTRTWSCERNTDEVWSEMLQVLRVGRMWRGEMACRRKDGTRYDAATTVAPLFDPDDADRLIGSVWAQRDITPFKEAERLKNQFISNVSHELRTPLSIVALTSDNLDAFYERLEEATRREMIGDIREQARLLNDLVGDVLEISRIDSGRISMERAPTDLVQLVYEEVEKQRPLAQNKSQTLHVIGAESLAVRANEGQLRQVLRNLLNNAIKYTPDAGQVTCECLVQVTDVDAEAGRSRDADGLTQSPSIAPWAAVRVIDTGVGVDQKDLPHLFERFYRAEPEGSVPGTGLGLFIAQELVELHGGRIVVSSTPGEGCIFTVYLPLLEE